MKEYLWPQKVYTKDGVGTENLFRKQALQIWLAEKKTTVFGDGDYVILDFGAELCGGIRILTHRGKDTPVRIRFGESLTECCSEIGGEQNATNDHSLRDLTVHLQNFSDMSFGQTGFRFVRLDFGGEAKIKSVVAENRIFKKPALYRYEGDDPQIAAIYQAAKRTIDLCISSGYVWDGVKRDRLVWIGDMGTEVIALTALYGRLPCIERSLDFVRKQTPLPGWMNNYPMYSMWWIIILADYYEKTGVKDFIQKQMPYLSGLLKQMDGCICADGTLNYPSYFVDWPTHNQPDELAGVRAINIIAMKKAIFLQETFGQDSALARELLERLLKIEITAQTSKQVLGLKYFATGLSEEDKAKLTAGGAKGMSTFLGYYILKAVASFDKEKAVAMMKEYYGAMLDKGATTFWEDFDVEWTKNSGRIDAFPEENQRDIHGDFGAYCYKGFRHSLCHGWSAGVIGFLKEEL
ncbi:MAG: alpha-L-rhamnosidase [Clostridia bacterium]|nr:alpha-L-rhamnosidase [Clostridia bacterium]